MSVARRLSHVTGIIGVLVIYAGILVVGLIAVAATSRLGARLDAIWADLPGVIGFRGVAMALVYLACVGALVVGIRRAGEATLRRFMPWGGLLLLVAIRMVAIPLIETPLTPDNDPFYLHQLAVGVLDGGNWMVSPRPMGFSAMLGALYAVFGIHPWLGEVLNLALATAAGWMLYRFVLVGWGGRPAAMALTLYAVVLSQILLVTTIFTEVAYSAFLLAALIVAARAVRSGRFAVALAAGALLALSQYVRPLSQAFLATFVMLPFLSGLRPSRAATLAAGMTLTFLVVLAPVAVHNVTAHGSLSLATSSYGGWSVFVGANQEHGGMFNRDDQAILRATPGSVWEQSEILGRAGIERITADPRGFAELATRKFRIMWGDDTYAVGAALSGSTVSDPIREGLELASQATYAVVAGAAAVGLWRTRRRPSPEALLLAGVLVTVAVAHIFVEVQPRYHAYTLPLLCALAAIFLGAAPASTNDPAGSPYVEDQGLEGPS
ncbi:MAG: hypothetical protein ACRDG7_07470 [Candidatus Limnocylindria bacterium]